VRPSLRPNVRRSNADDQERKTALVTSKTAAAATVRPRRFVRECHPHWSTSDQLVLLDAGYSPASVLRDHRIRGGGLIYDEPKTRRNQRTLALPMPLVAELHRHKAAQLGERMLAGSEWQDEDLVFAQVNGRPIDKKTDYDDWTRLLQAAGVRHVRLHDGRHTAATLLLSENVHPWVVMELLGHSQMRTTMDIYSHVMPALAREAADRTSTLLPPGKGGQTATRDDSGHSPEGERPGHRGGAEGTRTPDPHTARPS
jgi:integrase